MPAILAIWRSASYAYTHDRRRDEHAFDRTRVEADRDNYNIDHPGMLPNVGTFNRTERSRLRGKKQSAQRIQATASTRINRIQTDRDTAAVAFAGTKKTYKQNKRDMHKTVLSAIQTEMQNAQTRYEAATAPLRPWQIIKFFKARSKRNWEMMIAEFKALRGVRFFKTFIEKQKLRLDYWEDRRIHLAEDKIKKDRQALVIEVADRNYKRRMDVVRADRRSNDWNTVKNLWHASKKITWHTRNGLTEIFHGAAGVRAGASAAFEAGAREAVARTHTYLSTRPRLWRVVHAVRHAFP